MIKDKYAYLKDALDRIGRNDQDRCTVENGIGFNGRHSGTYHEIFEGKSWEQYSPKMIALAHKIVVTYKNTQVPDLKDLIESVDPLKDSEWNTFLQQHEEKKAFERTERARLKLEAPKTYSIVDDVLSISFPYDPQTVADVKCLIPKPSFSWDTKKWSIRLEKSNPLMFQSYVSFFQKREFSAQTIDLQDWINEAQEEIHYLLSLSSKADGEAIDIPFLNPNRTPYPFQYSGIQYALDKKRVLIADEQGLGKTFQAIGTVAITDAYPLLVVAPANVKYNWRREFTLWLTNFSKDDVYVCRGRKAESVEGKKVVVINYDLLGSWVKELKTVDWKAIVLDEAHYIKNAKTIRFKSIMEIKQATKPEYRLAMTGTPILNRIPEVKAILEFLDRYNDVAKGVNFTHAYMEFNDYTHPIHRKQALVFRCYTDIIMRQEQLITEGTPEKMALDSFVSKGLVTEFLKYVLDRNLDKAIENRSNANLIFREIIRQEYLNDLNNRLRINCMVRREKKDVLTELPDKISVDVPVDISNREEYIRAEEDMCSWIDENISENTNIEEVYTRLGLTEEQYEALDDKERKKLVTKLAEDKKNRYLSAEILVKIETLRQIALKGKMEEIFSWIDDFLLTGKKLVVFGIHQSVVKQIAKRYNCPAIYGGVDSLKRQAIVDQFQEDPNCNLIVANIIAGGEGITLTASSDVLFVESYWNPGKMDQASDRVHRIGQTKGVTIYHMISEETIEEDIYALVDNKRLIVNGATSGKVIESLSNLSNTARILKSIRSRIIGKPSEDLIAI
jgi:SWI/SNF-related matrix-associated actin-dependent regulator 1 of chromatin subfamily A